MPSELVGIFILLVGMARAVALVINGRSVLYGPRVRGWSGGRCSDVGPVRAGARNAVRHGAIPPPGIPFCFSFTLAELYSAYRAAGDARDRST